MLSLLFKEQQMSPKISYLCISSRKQVHLFFPALATVHASVQGLEKSILQIYQFRQTQLLAKKRRKLLVHKDIMEGAAEQIPVSKQDKARNSLGFVLRTICIITRPEITCVPWYRRLHVPLICNLSFQSSDTEIPTCWKLLQCQ